MISDVKLSHHFLLIKVKQRPVRNTVLKSFRKQFQSTTLCVNARKLLQLRTYHCKGVLKSFAIFIGKHLHQNCFISCNFIKENALRRSFPVNFARFLRTPFLQNTSASILQQLLALHFAIISSW